MSRMKKSAAFAAAAVALVGTWEGLQLTAYRDVVGVPTICYGETRNVRMGMTATKAECDAQLVRALVAFEDGMLACLSIGLPPNAQLAFLSLTYNIGVKAFCRSTAAKRINAGDLAGACAQILRFNRAGGVVWRGLDNRRKAEHQLCMKDVEG
jgi:lysozyme